MQLERSRQSLREEFQRLAKEHHGTTLTKAELNWLMRKAGAIVKEEVGMTDVDFYGNSLELDRAWQEYTMDVVRDNEEEYGTEWRRYSRRYRYSSSGLGSVNVEPHFKIRRD